MCIDRVPTDFAKDFPCFFYYHFSIFHERLSAQILHSRHFAKKVRLSEPKLSAKSTQTW